MDPINLTSQEGMETHFRQFCSNWEQDQDGRINELCRPQFVDCDFEKKTLCLSYFVQDWMRNSNGVMHGGIVSTVFDLTMGLLSGYCAGGTLTPTTTMQVTYLRPIPAGETLVIKAYCNMTGKTMCAISAKSWLETKSNKLTDTASATYYTGSSRQQSKI